MQPLSTKSKKNYYMLIEEYTGGGGEEGIGKQGSIFINMTVMGIIVVLIILMPYYLTIICQRLIIKISAWLSF